MQVLLFCASDLVNVLTRNLQTTKEHFISELSYSTEEAEDRIERMHCNSLAGLAGFVQVLSGNDTWNDTIDREEQIYSRDTNAQDKIDDCSYEVLNFGQDRLAEIPMGIFSDLQETKDCSADLAQESACDGVLDNIFDQNIFEVIKSEQPAIRISFYRFINTISRFWPQGIKRNIEKLAPVVLGSFSEKDSKVNARAIK